MRTVVLVLAAALFSMPVGARADMNYHNGAIQITNATNVTLEFTVVPNGTRVHIAPGETRLLNDCCYAAGTRYTFMKYHRGVLSRPISYGDVNPKLCAKHGSSFGWAVVRLVGFANAGVSSENLTADCP